MTHTNQHYYVPEYSTLPLIGSIALFFTLLGIPLLINGVWFAPYSLAIGGALLILVMFLWFGAVIRESRRGLYSHQIDVSFRWGMIWFIISEVFFFAVFFGVLFYTRVLTLPWLDGQGHHAVTGMLLWPDFEQAWPLMLNPDANVVGPSDYVHLWPVAIYSIIMMLFIGVAVTTADWVMKRTKPVKTIIMALVLIFLVSLGIQALFFLNALQFIDIPFVNTLILLTSAVTLTWAHWSLINGKRGQLLLGLLLTIALGLTFLSAQAYEYYLAYSVLGLTLDSGIYGTVFFMLTGFHGLHVTIGSIILLVLFFRALAGHFDKHNHFAFEAGAWYWHFVDVVWLVLFIFVYWL